MIRIAFYEKVKINKAILSARNKGFGSSGTK